MQQKKTFAILLSLAMIVTIVLGNGTFVSAATTEAITGIQYNKNNNYKCYAKSHHHFILLQISCHIDKI